MDAKDIKSMTLGEISHEFAGLSYKPFRAAQVYKWIVSGAESFDCMTNLSKDLRDNLKSIYCIPSVKIADKRVSSDGTVKYLFKLDDNELIEAVLMSYHHGYSMCLSTQAGCRMGCSFCSTGKSEFARNLKPSEMLGQIHAAQKDAGIRVSNIVLMGMGEPLDNYDNTVRFLKLVSSDDNIGIGMRHISLSTCGIVDKIYKLAEENFQLTLSVSLHAPNDKLRSSIMKVNNRWNVHELMEACKYYVRRTGRRISFEYAMAHGVTDTPECAKELSLLPDGMLCHVNLIPLNESEEHGILKKSSQNRIYSFKNILEKSGISTTIRRTLGKDIEAACGQLKRKHTQIQKEVGD